MWHIHSMEHCIATKMNNLHSHTIWLTFTNLMSSKRSKTQKNACYIISFIEIPKTGKANLFLNLANL